MLLQQLTEINERLAAKGFETEPIIIEPPATEEELRAMEETLGVALPPSFRRVLRTVSSRVDFYWDRSGDASFPTPFHQIFSGVLAWSLRLLPELEEGRQGWIADCFDDREDPYDAVWWDKLAFAEVGNGDQLAIDLRPENYEQIVYLSHDSGEGHGHVLAKDFEDLLTRWVPLACPGPEDWQWLPFTNEQTTPIDPDSENARKWKALLELP